MMKARLAISFFLLLGIHYIWAQDSTENTLLKTLEQEVKALTKERKYDLANQKMLEMQALLAKENDWESYANNSIDLAMNYYRLYKDSLAITSLAESIKLVKDRLSADDPVVGLLYHKLGTIHYFLKAYDTSITQYLEAIRIREKMSIAPNPDLAGSYYNIGLSHSFLGEYDTAISYLKKGIKIRKQQNDTTTLAQCYKVLGENYGLIGDYQLAKSYLDLSLDLYRKFYGEVHLQVGLIYFEIGKLYTWMEEPNQAISFLQKALHIYQELRLEKQQANTLYFLNSIYRQLDQFDLALDAAQQALSIHQKKYGEESIYAAKGFNNIALVYKAQKRYELALQNLNHSLSIRQKIYKGKKHPDIAASYDNIGNVMHAQKKYDLAISNYQLALSHLIPEFKDSLTQANPDFKRVLVCQEKLKLLTVLMDKAISLNALFQVKKENAYLENALQTSEICSKLLDYMKRNYEHDGSKLFWSGKIKPFFEQAIETALLLYERTKDKNFKDLAFSYAEKSKASLLTENQKEIVAQIYANIPASVLKKEKDIKTKIVQIQEQIYKDQIEGRAETTSLKDSLLSLNNQYKEFVDQLENDFPQYHRFKYSEDILSIKNVQQQLIGASTCLVEFFYGEQQIYVFSISKDQTKVEAIPLTEELLSAIKKLNANIGNPDLINQNLEENFAQFTSAASFLYDKLLRPVLPEETNKKKLIIIPDGLLSYIPFECLLTQAAQSNDVNFQELAYLMKRYEVSYAYSSIMLQQNEHLAQSLIRNNRLVTFAPNYAEEDNLPVLYGAKEETKQILSFYPIAESFENGKATKQNFIEQVGQFGIVHLALHANVDSENSKRSCLYFSRNGNDNLVDNILYNYELYALDLNAKLVVLSACETGTGQSYAGEGVMSLARGFMNAGTAAVVMSLWTTNDKSSQQIMIDFHRQLSSSQPASTALHQAKLNYLQNPIDPIAHPYYWASFISTGSTSTLVEASSPVKKYAGLAVACIVFLGLIVFTVKPFA